MPKKGRQATRTTPGFSTQFKGAPQQGTLFDVGTLPKTGDEIGPRGYSLNRSRQFNDIIQKRPGFNMQAGQVGFGMKFQARPQGRYVAVQGANYERGTEPAIKPDEHPFGPSFLRHAKPPEEVERGGGELPKSLGRGRSKLIDTLARSTVSPKQMKGLSEIRIHPKDPGTGGSYIPARRSAAGASIQLNVTGSSGEDRYGGREEGEHIPSEDYPPHVKRGQQRGPVDPDTEQTLLHEVGHHVSFSAGTPSSRYQTGEEQGAEEAGADAFSMKHYREDPRNLHWGGRHDPREHSYVAHGELGRFGDQGMVEYLRNIGGENLQRPSATLAPTLERSADVERHERPMLDEPRVEEHREGWRTGGDSGEVFKDYIKGFRSIGMGDSDRQSIYKKAAQTTNMGLSESAPGGWKQEQAERKRRWGVRRGTLGRQWAERDKPDEP